MEIFRSKRSIYFYLSLLVLCLIMIMYSDWRINSGQELFRPGALVVGSRVLWLVCIVLVLKVVVNVYQVIKRSVILHISSQGIIINNFLGNSINHEWDTIKSVKIKQSTFGGYIKIVVAPNLFRTKTINIYEVDITNEIANELQKYRLLTQ